jgi:phage terminase small subunit
VVALVPAVVDGGAITPLRDLDAAGLAEWGIVWSEAWPWLAPSDVPAVQRYCEAVDDLASVRGEMLAAQAVGDRGTWRLRNQVTDARKAIAFFARELGLSPSARAELGVAEVKIQAAVVALTDRSDSVTVIDLDDG